MRMTARRATKPRVVPLARSATPQAPHLGATRRDGGTAQRLPPLRSTGGTRAGASACAVGASRRCSSLVWNHQTALLAPCAASQITLVALMCQMLTDPKEVQT